MTFNEFFYNNHSFCNQGEYVNLDLEYFKNLSPQLQLFMVSPSSVFIIDGDEHHDTLNTIYNIVFGNIQDGLICIIDPDLVPCTAEKKNNPSTTDNNGDGDVLYATVYEKNNQTVKKYYYNTWSSIKEFIYHHKSSLVLIVGSSATRKESPTFYKNILDLDVPKTIIATHGSLNKKHLNGFVGSRQIEFLTLPKVTQLLMIDHIHSLLKRLGITYDNKNTITTIAAKSNSDIRKLNSILHTLMFQMYIRRNKHLTITDLNCLDTPKVDRSSTIRLHSHTRNLLTVAIPVIIITVPMTLFSYSKWDYTMVMINSSKIYKSITSKIIPQKASVTSTMIDANNTNDSTSVSGVMIEGLEVTDNAGNVSFEAAMLVGAAAVDGGNMDDALFNEQETAVIIDEVSVENITPTLGSDLLGMKPETVTLVSYATVLARVLNMRNAPSLNSDVILQSQRGAVLEVVDSHSQLEWVLVRDARGTEAWVAREFVSLAR